MSLVSLTQININCRRLAETSGEPLTCQPVADGVASKGKPRLDDLSRDDWRIGGHERQACAAAWSAATNPGISMSFNRSTLKLAALLVALVASGCATTQRGATEWDGLVRQPGTRLDAVFVRPDAEIPAYRNILLKPAEVRFARNWDPNRGGRSAVGRLNAADMAPIQADLATMFHDIFREVLTAGGYQLVTETGPDTLVVIPAIIDLYITAPDTMTAGRSRTYTANSGRMTLVLELRDSVTGESLARVVDTRSGRSFGTMQITNRVTNNADARRAIRIWARALRGGLDSLHKGAN
jgi:hypothetical protein